MWKSARSGAALLCAALLATACAGGEQAGTDTGSPEKVTLSYGVWDATQQAVMQELATEFTKTHPNVAVDVQLTPWVDYWTKLKAAVSGGAAPDVFWMNGPNFQLYASNGVIKPIEEQVDTSVWPKPLVDLYTYEGKLYGLPKDMDTVGVWYNKTLFDAAKVEISGRRLDLGRLQGGRGQAHRPGQGRVRRRGAAHEFQEYQYNTIYQAGGHVISPDGKKSGYDDPKTIEGLKFWTDLIAAKQSPDLKTMTDTATLQLFEAGKLAMYWGGSWNVAEFTKNDYTKDKVDVAPLPKGEKQATIIHGVANVMSAKTEHPARGVGVRQVPRLQAGRRHPGQEGPHPGLQRHAERLGGRPSGAEAADVPRRRRLRGAVPGLQEHRRLAGGGAHPPHQGVDGGGADREGRHRPRDRHERPAGQGVT